MAGNPGEYGYALRAESGGYAGEIIWKTFAGPLFAGPVGAVKLHYGEKYTDQEYNEILGGGDVLKTALRHLPATERIRM